MHPESPEQKVARQGRGRVGFTLRPLAWVGLGAVLFLGPLFQGLFFEGQYLPVAGVLAAAFALAAWQDAAEGRWPLGRHPVEWAAGALALAYLVAVPGAADPREARLAAIKAAMYFLAAVTAAGLVAAGASLRAQRDRSGGKGFRTGEGRGWGGEGSPPAARPNGGSGVLAEGAARRLVALAALVVGAATLVAALGVLAAAGVVELEGGLSGRRILSTLQYHNALAAYVALANLTALGLLVAARSAVARAALSGSILILLVALLGTHSRGGWLAGLAGLAALLAVLPAWARWRAAGWQLTLFLLAASAARPILAGAGSPGYHGVGGLALTLAAAAALPYLAGLAGRLVEPVLAHPRRGRLALGLGGAYLGVVALVYAGHAALLPGGPGDALLPASVAARAEAIDPGQASFTGRREWARTAWRIFRDHPWRGAGGGAWNALYQRYQRELAWSTEAHASLAQVAAEAGIGGAAAFAAAWLLLGRAAWRLRESTVALGLAAGVLTLVLHSLGDFDLSFPALAVTAWAGAGAVGGAELAARSGARGRRPGRAAAVGLAVAGMALAAAVAAPAQRFYTAGMLGAEGGGAMLAGKPEEAMAKLREAARLDPWKGSYLLDQAQLFAAAAPLQPTLEERRAYEREALRLTEEAMRVQPNDLRVTMAAAGLLTALGRPEEAYRSAERLASLLPLNPDVYGVLAHSALEAGVLHLRYGEAGRAEGYLRAAAGVPERAEGALNRPGTRWRPYRPAPWRARLAAAQARFLLGEEDKAEPELQAVAREAGDKALRAEARLWLALAAERRGDEEAAGREAEAATDGFPGDVDRALEALRSLPRIGDGLR